MYKIIGADRQEYGPETAEQVRQWIAEGRANGQTLARAEGTAEWKPLAAFPEFAGLFGPAVSAAGPSASAPPDAEQLLARDYDLDIGSCISRAWALMQQNLGPAAGITFVMIVILGTFNQVIGLFTRPVVNDIIHNHTVTPGGVLLLLGTSLISTPLYTVVMGGLFKYYLKLIRGEPAGFGDAFYGFAEAFVPLVTLGLATGALTLIGYALCVIPGIYLGIAWSFAIPLVVDRGMGFWDALELSRRVVSKHWFLTFAFLLVIGLLGGIGIFACCIGILFTLPFSWMAWMYAYEDIFVRPSR